MRRASDIPAPIVNLRIQIAVQHGARREDILSAAALTEELVSDPANRISVDQTMAVWEAIEQQTGSQDIGLESGLKVRMQSLGILGYVMMNSNSLESAFQKLCNYQRLVASITFQSVVREGAYTYVRSELKESWEPLFRYTIDFVIAGSFAMIRNNLAKNSLPVEVAFNFPEPSNAHRYQEIFSPAQVLFDCPNPYLKYHREDLQHPIIGASGELFDHFEKMLHLTTQEHDKVQHYARSVKGILQERLMGELPKIDDVAKEMAVSVRSLQQYLKEEGFTFQGLLNEVRKNISMHQLKNSAMQISDVAFLTGFSDLSVFSRNFKKWTGVSPSQYKAQFS